MQVAWCKPTPVDMLLACLHSHLTTHPLSHWCFTKFISPNLPVVAAIIVLQNHILDDIGSTNKIDCLLGNVSCLRRVEDCQLLIGAYLYYDDNKFQFIRSGKAISMTFHQWHMQYMIMTSSNSLSSSKFYASYPTKAYDIPDLSCLG